MARRIQFEEELCTNCHLCMMYCSITFSKDGIFEYRPSASRIRVSENEPSGLYIAHVCLQCPVPACMDVCPTEAISMDATTGVVVIEELECTGCEECIEACEYGCIFMYGETAIKCEVCDNPLCVQACATQALQVVDNEEIEVQQHLYRENRL